MLKIAHISNKDSLKKTGKYFVKIRAFEERNKVMDLRCWEIKVSVGRIVVNDLVYFVFACIVLTYVGLLAKYREVT